MCKCTAPNTAKKKKNVNYVIGHTVIYSCLHSHGPLCKPVQITTISNYMFPYVWFYIWVVLLFLDSLYAAQTDLRLKLFLSLPPRCWDCRNVPPYDVMLLYKRWYMCAPIRFLLSGHSYTMLRSLLEPWNLMAVFLVISPIPQSVCLLQQCWFGGRVSRTLAWAWVELTTPWLALNAKQLSTSGPP